MKTSSCEPQENAHFGVYDLVGQLDLSGLLKKEETTTHTEDVNAHDENCR